jgi:hypothetical protein
MKLTHLLDLIIAAEVGCPELDDEGQRADTKVAIEAAYEEYRTRYAARQAYRETRPAQTVTRNLIRAGLLAHYHKVRLNRLGQWHVQAAPGLSWQLFAQSDSEAQEQLIDYKEKSHACTKI